MATPKLDPIDILGHAYCEVDRDTTANGYARLEAAIILRDAIQHLARPERDVYPKVRHATKSHPFTKP